VSNFHAAFCRNRHCLTLKTLGIVLEVRQDRGSEIIFSPHGQGFPAGLATELQCTLSCIRFLQIFLPRLEMPHTTTAARAHRGALFFPPRKPIAIGHEDCLGLRTLREWSLDATPSHFLHVLLSNAFANKRRVLSLFNLHHFHKHELVHIGFYASFSLERG
jgi:hypothetical protein